MIIEFNMD